MILSVLIYSRLAKQWNAEELRCRLGVKILQGRQYHFLSLKVALTDSWGYLVNSWRSHYVSSVWHLSQLVSLINDALTLPHLFSLSATDLVMKVDALLTAAPKGEVRRDVHFIRDSHRWPTYFFFPSLLVLLALQSHSTYVIMDPKIASPSFQAARCWISVV